MKSWGGAARAVYINGEHSQVFATMMGIEDAKCQYGDFGYPVQAVTQVTTPGPRFADWSSFLNNWYGIAAANLQRELVAGDVLLVLDVDEKSDGQVVRRALDVVKQASASGIGVFHILQPGANLARELRGVGNSNGSNNSYLNVFAYQLLESVFHRRNPANIGIFGTGLRTVTTAIGALDFLSRFDSTTQTAQLVRRILVDQTVPAQTWGQPNSLEAALTAFQFPWIADNPGMLSPANNKVLVTPVQ
jgi:hypothetical protein